MTTPSPLPAWFLPLSRYHYGLGPRPTTAPKPAPQWCLLEWHQFDLWSAWKSAGGASAGPRPSQIWHVVPAWAWQIRRELLAAGHAVNPTPPIPPPVPIPHPTPGFPMVPSKSKGRNGLYFYTYVNASAAGGEAGVIALAKKYDLWVALLVHELGRAPEPSYDTDAQRRRLQSEGITVVASGWVDSTYDLNLQAEAAAHYSQGYDEYMLNAEASWAYVPGQPTDGFAAMGAFAPLLRQKLGPAMPISLSCMWGQVTWLRPLLQAGLSAVRPQCYLNQWGHMNPADAMMHLAQDQGDLPGGIEPGMVEATYGKYGEFMQPLSTWTAQDDAAVAKGMKARSVWAGEFCDPNDYAWVAR